MYTTKRCGVSKLIPAINTVFHPRLQTFFTLYNVPKIDLGNAVKVSPFACNDKSIPKRPFSPNPHEYT